MPSNGKIWRTSLRDVLFRMIFGNDMTQNYSGRGLPTHECVFQMLLGCTGSCEPAGRVQMHNTGGVHWQILGNHKSFRVLKAWLLRPFVIIYKEFISFTHTDIYKLQFGFPNYMRPKSVKRCPNRSRMVPAVILWE